jgi:hypothetical protein
MGLVQRISGFGAQKNRLDPKVMAKALPFRNDFVIEIDQPDGGLALQAPLEETGKGFWAALAKRSRTKPHKTFELEPVGAFIWRQCDGKTTFQSISKRLQAEYKLSRIEADASLGAFLQMLSQRRLITMMVDKK